MMMPMHMAYGMHPALSPPLLMGPGGVPVPAAATVYNPLQPFAHGAEIEMAAHAAAVSPAAATPQLRAAYAPYATGDGGYAAVQAGVPGMVSPAAQPRGGHVYNPSGF
jgi:hypothetical protein